MMCEASKGCTIGDLRDEFASLGQLLATWPTHDLNHIHQIAKCMAWQYRDEIGPWRAYVRALANA